MCGIAGILSADAAKISPQRLAKMTTAIAHRGPDGEGVWISPSGLAGLGHLAENSVRWAAFEDQSATEWVRDIKEASLGNHVRAERMKQWSIEWEQFCLWIVTEFGDDGESVRKIREESSFDAQD